MLALPSLTTNEQRNEHTTIRRYANAVLVVVFVSLLVCCQWSQSGHVRVSHIAQWAYRKAAIKNSGFLLNSFLLIATDKHLLNIISAFLKTFMISSLKRIKQAIYDQIFIFASHKNTFVLSFFFLHIFWSFLKRKPTPVKVIKLLSYSTAWTDVWNSSVTDTSCQHNLSTRPMLEKIEFISCCYSIASKTGKTEAMNKKYYLKVR